MSPYFLIFNKIWAFFMNLVTLLFGAGMIDKKIKRNDDLQQIEPFIRNLKDMTDPDKVIIMHPYIIGYYVLNYIKTWRLRQVHKLEKKLNETVRQLKETKQQLQRHRQVLLKKSNLKVKERDHSRSNEKVQKLLTKDSFSKRLIKEIQHYQQEIKSLSDAIESIKYAIPNKFKKKTVLPKGDLYTQCPLKDDEK